MIRYLFIFVLSLVLLPGRASMVEARSLPNVIFLLTDDLGYSDISCYGAKKVKTPHLDRLAAEGMMFKDFHTAASICSPSRAAFLTGAYPRRRALHGNQSQRRAHSLGLHPDHHHGTVQAAGLRDSHGGRHLEPSRSFCRASRGSTLLRDAL